MGKAQCAVFLPAQPAMAHVETHAGLAQAMQPGAQQRRGFHLAREDAAGAADEGLDAQAVYPCAQLVGVEAAHEGRHLFTPIAVAWQEVGLRFGVRDVHAAASGQQEFAASRGHGVVDVHGGALCGQHFGGHQAGRTGADHGHAAAAGSELGKSVHRCHARHDTARLQAAHALPADRCGSAGKSHQRRCGALYLFSRRATTSARQMVMEKYRMEMVIYGSQ
jgi:hypothetical protein